MKKLLLAAVAAAAMAFAGVATADPVDTPVGTLTVNEGGYVLLADGNADNPDPVDGYVSVTEGNACVNDAGNPDDTDGDGVPNGEDENDDNAQDCAQ
ncbi:MAG TPA: hypothetical protein VNT32_10220 [Thermoleophilaceae bacterium]|nr:hypothetical protein [Thermoleophilaceae bacterium]